MAGGLRINPAWSIVIKGAENVEIILKECRELGYPVLPCTRFQQKTGADLFLAKCIDEVISLLFKEKTYIIVPENVKVIIIRHRPFKSHQELQKTCKN